MTPKRNNKRSLECSTDTIDEVANSTVKVPSSENENKKPKLSSSAIYQLRIKQMKRSTAMFNNDDNKVIKETDKIDQQLSSRLLKQKEEEDKNKKKEPKFFLFKSEATSRIYKGKEMKFSIDDLIAQPLSTTSWEGIRNFNARNVMLEMHLGDRALFYHSNPKRRRCAIVGEVEIVREAYPDPTALDKSNPHYDAKVQKKNQDGLTLISNSLENLESL